MADAGLTAQDVGEFRRRDRGHSAEKGGVFRRGMVTTRTPGRKFVGCRTFGVMAFKRSEEDRVASRASLPGAIRQRPIPGGP